MHLLILARLSNEHADRDIQHTAWWPKPVWQRGFTALSLCALLLQTCEDGTTGKCSLSLTCLWGQTKTQPVFMFPVFPCNLPLGPWICWALIGAEGFQLAHAGRGCLPSMSCSRPVLQPQPALTSERYVVGSHLSALLQASDELKMA